MNVVLIIPTGIGCEIGGHAGDATPVAKLIGKCCDKLILHPNVVNASDINEMPENALYVEGSILDRFLEEKVELQEVKQNRVLVVVNAPIHNETINAVSAARATLGLNAKIMVLEEPLLMYADMKDGKARKASGEVHNWTNLVDQVDGWSFDALAIATPITVDAGVTEAYFNGEIQVNPWGGVEAKASKLIANKLNKPVAHSPVFMGNKKTILEETDIIVDPRMSAEIISYAFLHCVLKGLQKAPRIVQNHMGYGHGLSARDMDVMISPHGCWGRPHEACFVRGLPIIEVMENKTIYSKRKVTEVPEHYTIQVKNYWEAAGYVMCMNSGIFPKSVRRPLEPTKII